MVCVCVPTDEGKYVKLGHFGDAKYYYHYLFEGGKWRLAKKVSNPFTGQHVLDEDEEEESEKRINIYEMNKECDFIVAIAFGKGGQKFMEKRGLGVIKVKPRTTVEEALQEAERFIKAGVSSEGRLH
ncbi:MAG: hypothetical protein J7L55_02840 [Desulfurococcales archaeon]|nr:hypothetical protein [Desulfurococcales archaeon]